MELTLLSCACHGFTLFRWARSADTNQTCPMIDVALAYLDSATWSSITRL